MDSLEKIEELYHQLLLHHNTVRIPEGCHRNPASRTGEDAVQAAQLLSAAGPAADLHRAIMAGAQPSVAEVLAALPETERTALLAAPLALGMPPLHLACIIVRHAGCWAMRLACLAALRLLCRGVESVAKPASSRKCYHHSGFCAAVDELVDAGAPLEAATPRHGTALHLAAVLYTPAVVELLLRRGEPLLCTCADSLPAEPALSLAWRLHCHLRRPCLRLLSHSSRGRVNCLPLPAQVPTRWR